MQRKTNWYVITGGPSSGKTTKVNLLKERGYITTFEAAQRKIHELLFEVYESLSFPLIHVPVLPPEERFESILKNI